MSTIWVLIANATDVKIFKSQSPKMKLQKVTEVVCPQARMKNRELVTDKAGSVFSASAKGMRHSFDPEESPKEHSENIFAKDLVHMLEHEFAKKNFDELVLVAEPAFLGKIKANLGKSIAGHIAATLSKNLLKVNENELDSYLDGILQELWRDPRRHETIRI